MKKIVIIDYKIGNLGSLINMLKKTGDHDIEISSERGTILNSNILILPGVGSFDKGMENLQQNNLISILNEAVIEKKIPIIGICLGMQLFGSTSEEGKSKGLGWIDMTLKKFIFDNKRNLKVPHMGWNIINSNNTFCDKLLTGLESFNKFYFVHSYYAVCNNKEDILSITNYGFDFVSAVRKDNIYGFQFHPEKSHKYGCVILTNLIKEL
jgi:glutamine amidotransferase